MLIFSVSSVTDPMFGAASRFSWKRGDAHVTKIGAQCLTGCDVNDDPAMAPAVLHAIVSVGNLKGANHSCEGNREIAIFPRVRGF